MSRILLACDDGTERTEIAADFLNEEGYTAVQAIDGGIDQYLEEFPLEEKDKIVWKMSDADRSGPDTSALLHGVSTEQVNTIEGPVMNRQWLLQMKGKFPNKMSRILLACDDGTERMEIAADFLNEEGYTAVQAIDGGIDQYLEEFPLEEKDKIVWKMSDADRSGPDTA